MMTLNREEMGVALVALADFVLTWEGRAKQAEQEGDTEHAELCRAHAAPYMELKSRIDEVFAALAPQ